MNAAYPILTLHDPKQSLSDPITDVTRAVARLLEPCTPYSDAAQREALLAAQQDEFEAQRDGED